MSEPTVQQGVPPLAWPHYGISPIAAVKRGYAKYATFSGRASRSEFWWWALFVGLGYLVPGFLALIVAYATQTPRADGSVPMNAPSGILIGIAGLVLLSAIVPSIAISVRRLHDAGFSGWFYLLNFIPSVGGLIVLIMCVLPTSPQAERWGPPYLPRAPYGPGPYQAGPFSAA